MPYLYLVLSVIGSASSSVIGTYFNKKNALRKGTSPFYNLVQQITCLVCWLIIFLIDFEFNVAVLPYSILFAISFALANWGIIQSLKHGPTSLTSLMISLSLMIPTVWGFFFWDARLTIEVVIGLALVVGSICFCLLTGQKEEKKISLKWVVYIVIACVSNGGCTIIQRTQQTAFDGKYGGMLMFFALLASVLFFVVSFLLSDRSDVKVMLKDSWFFPVAQGFCNVVLNLSVMLLATTSLSSSIVFPVIGVGGLIVVMIFSIFAFKEKLKTTQWFGVILGVVATVLLSI